MWQQEKDIEERDTFLLKETNNNGDANIEIVGDKDSFEFTCLTKEQIEQYAKNPTWVKARWVLFLTFWIVWAVLLATAVLVVIFTPKCAYRPKLTWWDKEVIYQIDVENFVDSDGDLIGDLNGLISKLDYISEDLGVKTICLKNILESEKYDIDSKFGNDKILHNLRKELDSRDMHLILDIPAEILDKKSSIIDALLLHHADGIRVTDIDKINQDSLAKKLNDWNSKVKLITKQTFKPKFFSFIPNSNSIQDKEKINQDLVIDNKLAQLNSTLFENQSNVVNVLKSIYEKFDSYIGLQLGEFGKPRIQGVLKNGDVNKVLHSIVLLLKGTPLIMYGDEIELEGKNETMKWDNSVNCGFSSNNDGKSSDSCLNSVQQSLAHGSGETLIRIYHNLLKLRQEPSFSWGKIEFSDLNNEKSISFVRKANGFDSYLVASNIGTESHVIDYQKKHNITSQGQVSYFYSSNRQNNDFKFNQTILTSRISLKNGELLVLKLN